MVTREALTSELLTSEFLTIEVQIIAVQTREFLTSEFLTIAALEVNSKFWKFSAVEVITKASKRPAIVPETIVPVLGRALGRAG